MAEPGGSTSPPQKRHVWFFEGLILAGHSGTWRERFRGLRILLGAARRLEPEVLPAPVITDSEAEELQEQNGDE